jgi:hypothetical protein
VSRSWPASPPDFVGVGTQRSGTSWWYSLLEGHPRVQRLASATKELHFFDPFWEGPFGDEDVEAYWQCFRRPPGKLGGEWTPRYVFDAWTPPLLRRAAPDARLLVMLRDPVDRFASAMSHRVERGRSTDADAVGDAVSRGFYHQQLTRLLGHFPREQLLVLQFERCRDDTDTMFGRTLEFLGLEPASAPGESRPSNRTRSKVELPRRVQDDVRAAYRYDVEALAESFPDLDLRLWPNFSDLV